MAKYIKAVKLNHYQAYTVINKTDLPFEGREPVVVDNKYVCVPYETCQPGKSVTMMYDLIVEIKAATEKAFAFGDLVYWNDTTKVVTTDSKGALLCGVVIQKKEAGKDWAEIHFLGPLASLYTKPTPAPAAAVPGVGG